MYLVFSVQGLRAILVRAPNWRRGWLPRGQPLTSGGQELVDKSFHVLLSEEDIPGVHSTQASEGLF